MSETSGFFRFWLGKMFHRWGLPALRRLGTDAGSVAFWGNRVLIQWIWCFQNQVRCVENAKRLLGLKNSPFLLDVGILKSSIGIPNITNQDSSIQIFHVEDVFVLFISDVFFFSWVRLSLYHTCFLLVRLVLLAEGTKKNTQILPTSRGFFVEKKKQLMRQPPWRTKKTPKLGNIRINEARRWGRWWFRTPCTSWYGI